MNNRSSYVYCIIESLQEQRFGKIGIDKEDVHTINYRDLAAVVSNSPSKSYEVLRAGTTHQKVVETVMKKDVVIPMRFGQVSETEEDVKGLLRENYLNFKRTFARLGGKMELGVRATWKMDAVLKDLLTTNDRIRILNKQVLSLSPEKAYLAKITLGKLVAEALPKKGDRISSEIYHSLRLLAVESKINDNLTDEMIINAAFLIEKKREHEFDEKMDDIEKKYSETIQLRYILSPPYNFVSLDR